MPLGITELESKALVAELVVGLGKTRTLIPIVMATPVPAINPENMMKQLFTPTDEHSLLRNSVRSFVSAKVEPQAAKHDAEEKFNLELFRNLGSLGALGVTADEKFGGSGLGPCAAVIVHEELAYSDPGLCLAYLAHSMLCTNNISANASDKQKSRYLPKLCDGSAIGAMGMSEAGAGTDVRAMTTTAVKKGDNYIINGRKMWITNGSIDGKSTTCDVLLLYARTSSDEHGRANISTFLIEAGTKGFSVGQVIKGKLGVRASITSELVFDNCSIPKEALVGVEGESLIHMMNNLEIERLTLAAMALGIARRCLEVMVDYAQQRKAFGKSISSFGQIQSMIAQSYSEYQAARAYVYSTAHDLDNSGGCRINSDGVKLVAAPMAKTLADRAIQVLGGNGYISEYVVERMWRDAKLLEIGGGTIESHHKNIAKDLSSQTLKSLIG